MTSLRGFAEWTKASGSRWQQQPQNAEKKKKKEKHKHKCSAMSGSPERQSFSRGILVVWVFSEGFFSFFPIFWGFCYIPLDFLFFEMGDSSHIVWTLGPLLTLSLLFSTPPPPHPQWPASHFSDLSIKRRVSFSAVLNITYRQLLIKTLHMHTV